MKMTLVTPPASEPVTLAELKHHCRVDINDDDDYMLALIAAARQYAEVYQQRALVMQTWRLTLNYFPYLIKVPLPPLRTVTSIQYLDQSGVLQTLSPDSYVVSTDGAPGMICPAYGTSFPSTLPQLQCVRITFTAGYDSVPQATNSGIMMMAAHWYRNREAVSETSMTEVPLGCKSLLDLNVWGCYS